MLTSVDFYTDFLAYMYPPISGADKNPALMISSTKTDSGKSVRASVGRVNFLGKKCFHLVVEVDT